LTSKEVIKQHLLRDCYEKEIKFEKNREFLAITIDGKSVFQGSSLNEADFCLFQELDAELAGHYIEAVERKVSEITGISIEQLESEFDPDFLDYIDVYTPTLYARKVISVKVGEVFNNSWTYRPLKEVLAEVEKELKNT